MSALRQRSMAANVVVNFDMSILSGIDTILVMGALACPPFNACNTFTHAALEQVNAGSVECTCKKSGEKLLLKTGEWWWWWWWWW
jgi:hypothetical protein